MISRKHRTIFVHIPKCAGQSVEMAFLADNDLTWETRAPLLLRANDDPRAGPPRLAHLTAAEYVSCGHVGQEEFDRSYTFAIVRNPWARAVSLYRHLEPNIPYSAFVGEWLPGQLRDNAAKQRWFVRPQAEFVAPEGRVVVDDIVYLERLAQEFPIVAARAGLRSPLPHANRSGDRTAPDIERKRSLASRISKAIGSALTPKRFEAKEKWRDHYGEREVEAVATLYAADIETFGYKFAADGPVR